MKNIYRKLCCKLLVFILVFGVILCLVDLHTDGVLIRDGNYYIRPANDRTYQINVIDASQDSGALVEARRVVDGANQTFVITHIEGNQYALMYGNAGMCIAVASDKETVIAQGFDVNNDYNKWEITRIGTSQSFLFTNVATGNSLYYEYSNELKTNQMKVKEYDASNNKYEFIVVKYA